MTEVQKDLGEVIDRTKNAHHRIDETNTAIKELREEMHSQLSMLNSKVENIGINMANSDKRARKWRKWIIIIGIMAGVAFICTFIQDSDIKKTVGEIALKLGVGVASAI